MIYAIPTFMSPSVCAKHMVNLIGAEASYLFHRHGYFLTMHLKRDPIIGGLPSTYKKYVLILNILPWKKTIVNSSDTVNTYL